MKRFFTLWTMTALLAAAATARAQEPQDYPPSSPLPRELSTFEDNDPEANASSWYVQAAEHTVAAWQRLRDLCQATGCCETEAKSGVCQGVAGCGAGATGCAKGIQIQIMHGGKVIGSTEGCPAELRDLLLKVQKATQCPGMVAPCCDVKGSIQVQCPFAAAKTAAGCDCAKGCACCETCKATGAKTVQAQVPALPPSAALPWGMPPVLPWGASVPAWGAPFPQILPTPRMVIEMTSAVRETKPAHLVTPELEAHCQRIIHKDGHIILEGNVLLLCKKNAQPIRIEAPRVVVNMKDGSFVVESGAPTVTTNSVGVLRTFNITSPNMPLSCPESTPVQSRIITVVPVPSQGESPARQR